MRWTWFSVVLRSGLSVWLDKTIEVLGGGTVMSESTEEKGGFYKLEHNN